MSDKRHEAALRHVAAFNGVVRGGLVVHQDTSFDRITMYRVAGNSILRQQGEEQPQFLQGHNDKVSCIACSPTGRALASGQAAPMGLPADVCVWDVATGTITHRLSLQKVRTGACATINKHTVTCPRSRAAFKPSTGRATSAFW